jgi:hypothetical protein
MADQPAATTTRPDQPTMINGFNRLTATPPVAAEPAATPPPTQQPPAPETAPPPQPTPATADQPTPAAAEEPTPYRDEPREARSKVPLQPQPCRTRGVHPREARRRTFDSHRSNSPWAGLTGGHVVELVSAASYRQATKSEPSALQPAAATAACCCGSRPPRLVVGRDA